MPIPADWVGTSFDDKLSAVRTEHAAILIAVHSPGEPPNINPSDYQFASGDEVVLIARSTPELT